MVRGTKNVFADLGFPDAAERQAQLRLAYCVIETLDERNLSESPKRETIAWRYANPELARRMLDQTIHGVLLASAPGRPDPLTPAGSRAADRMAILRVQNRTTETATAPVGW